MRIGAITVAFFSIISSIKAQSNWVNDTTVYTFTVKPVADISCFPPICSEGIPIAYEFRVLECNYKYPVSKISIVSIPCDTYKKDKIYIAKIRIYYKQGDLSFIGQSNRANMFSLIFISEDYLYKYKKIVSKIYK